MSSLGVQPDGEVERTPVFWIDALRVAAAIAVVFLHVAAQPVVLLRDRASAAWWTANLIDASARWCVPIFVMLSGALLLARRGESMRIFFARRVRRIAIPIAAWSVAYIALHAWRRGMPSWGWIGDRLLHGRPEYHMWYVFMILGLYLLTPALRRYVAGAGRRRLAAACVALMLLACAHDALYSFGAAPAFQTVFTLYLPYLGYYLSGYALVRHPPRVAAGLLAATALISVGVIALGTRLLLDRHGVTPAGLYLYEYLSPPVIALSLSVYLLGARLPAPRAGGRVARGVRDLSAATLGIYLIHPMLLELLRAQGLRVLPLGVAGVPVVATSALLLSYAAVSVLRRLPVLRHTV